MTVLRSLFSVIGIFSLIFLSPALAQESSSCTDLANTIVDQMTREVVSDAVEKMPELKGLNGNQLASMAGRTLMTADSPDFKAYGYMMLLWYGGAEGRKLVAQAAEGLSTEEDRAHYYFVMGLFQIRSTKPKVAETGRDYIRQMRDSGKVTFASDAMWTGLIEECELPS